MGKQKGPRLTKEELAERKRTKKLLAKEKKEEQVRQVKRDELSRELEYCRLNREKYEKGWRKILLDLKMKDLHTDYQYHVSCSERLLDAKDMEISILLDELDIAGEQYEFNLKKYMINFDTIIDTLDQSLNHLKDQYDSDLEDLLATSEAERNEQKLIAQERQLNMKMMLFGLEKSRFIKANDTKSRYLSRIQEEEDMTMAEIELNQAALEQRFESLWRAYKETINEYKRDNDETKKKYEILHSQDSFMRKWIKAQTQQLFRAYDKIYKLRFEQSQEKDSIDLQLKAKMDEHQFFLNGFHTLKQQLKDDVNTDDIKSVSVVKYCNKSIKRLESLRYKGESILKLNGICRKFETAEELIMPYPEFEPPDSIHPLKSVATDQIKLYKEKKMLDMFLQRCSQGDALRNVLYEELEFYLQKNMILKRQLYNHCKTQEYSCLNVKKKNEKDGSKGKFLCVKNFSLGNM